MAGRRKPVPKSSTTDDKDRAEEAFVAAAIARGDAAKVGADGTLPAGATHEIVEDEQGRRIVRRRFSAF